MPRRRLLRSTQRGYLQLRGYTKKLQPESHRRHHRRRGESVDNHRPGSNPTHWSHGRQRRRGLGEHYRRRLPNHHRDLRTGQPHGHGGETTEVTVTLSADPERLVTIPLTHTPQDGAIAQDYSGVPTSIIFLSGETEKNFDLRATNDSLDDDGESVKLGFGETLPTGISEGTHGETVVSITDNDDPQVTVSFASATYTVTEGGTVAVTVNLSADPERTVSVSVNSTPQDGATAGDYSGAPHDPHVQLRGDQQELRLHRHRRHGRRRRREGQTDLRQPLDRRHGGQPQRVRGVHHGQRLTLPSPSSSSRHLHRRRGQQRDYQGYPQRRPRKDRHHPGDPRRAGRRDPALDYSGVPGRRSPSTPETPSRSSPLTCDQLTADDDDGESVKLGFGGTLPTGVSEGTTGETTHLHHRRRRAERHSELRAGHVHRRRRRNRHP